MVFSLAGMYYRYGQCESLVQSIGEGQGGMFNAVANGEQSVRKIVME